MTDNPPTLSKLTHQVVEQFSHYTQTGTKSWTYQTAATDLPFQVGSLLKLIMQLNGERYRNEKSDETIRIAIADELADILSLVLFIAYELNIDIYQAFDQMLKSDAQKFAERNPGTK